MKDNSLIYGIRAVMEAIEAGREFEKVMVQKGLTGDLYRELMQKLRATGTPLQMVPPETLHRLTNGNHQGVAAFVSAITYQPIEQIIPMLFEQGRNPFILILDRVTDVRNFGAIARTAECAGVDAILIPDHNSARITADAVKTSAGALHTIPVCRATNLFQTVKFLKNSGITLFAATEKGNIHYHSMAYDQPLALIMGSEENGVSADLLKISDHLVRIPLLGTIGSLNVSVAAGVLMYEVIRQRNYRDIPTD
ncbi:MAG: 23S rRNA (guanosine(2251)-2'-O)-methyltransferase RlmB [Bacteroidales bacterium]|nr:23S rRNA (guanosine(2251)-2'-O)-methyltransferase RlmB [Bacteroidales bacterium]MDD3666948.1 23S rRNA (guanosine(2251)-2'-O)-methyltransferase RlmB [Bacteroidales bacterium]